MASKTAVGDFGHFRLSLNSLDRRIARLVATPRRIFILILIACLGVSGGLIQRELSQNQPGQTVQTRPAAPQKPAVSNAPKANPPAAAASPASGLQPPAANHSAANAASAAPAVNPGQPSAAAGTILPSQLLDLSNWKLTLPIAKAGSSVAEEITQPQLAGFSLSPYFVADPGGSGVLFRAPVDGATTSGSSYPRSELRQMTNNGSQEAGWSTTAGTHSMTVREAVTHLPVAKPQVVSAQIHDANQDVIEILADGNRANGDGSFGLCVRFNGVEQAVCLTDSYRLGTAFTLQMAAGNGQILIYYNSVLKLAFSEIDSGDYFKAGCYTQSNLSKGDNSGAYGEVEIYSLATSDS